MHTATAWLVWERHVLISPLSFFIWKPWQDCLEPAKHAQKSPVSGSYLKEVQYLPIKDIDFTSARGKKRTLDDQIKAVDAENIEDAKLGELDQLKGLG